MKSYHKTLSDEREKSSRRSTRRGQELLISSLLKSTSKNGPFYIEFMAYMGTFHCNLTHKTWVTTSHIDIYNLEASCAPITWLHSTLYLHGWVLDPKVQKFVGPFFFVFDRIFLGPKKLSLNTSILTTRTKEQICNPLCYNHIQYIVYGKDFLSRDPSGT